MERAVEQFGDDVANAFHFAANAFEIDVADASEAAAESAFETAAEEFGLAAGDAD